MKVIYDERSDTLTVIFRQGEIVESEEPRPGVVLDFDSAGLLVSMEMLDASKRVEEPRSVTLESTP